MKHYRYDMYGAFRNGINEHPQKQMKNLGCNVVKAEPVTVADCWWFRVDNDIENVPEYLYSMSDDFKFSDER
jgi:hypothetical protein